MSLKWKREEPHHLGLYTANPPGAEFLIARSSEVSAGDAIWTLTAITKFRTLKSAKAFAQRITDNELEGLARRLGT